MNLTDLEKAVAEAFGQTIAEYDQEVDATIESTTAFADLGLEGRDIIDTGRLMNSKIVDIQGNRATFEWDPEDPDTQYHYAAAVWAGFYAYGGSKFIPGRHWPERAAYNMKITEAFVDYLNEQGVEAKITKNGDSELDY